MLALPKRVTHTVLFSNTFWSIESLTLYNDIYERIFVCKDAKLTTTDAILPRNLHISTAGVSHFNWAYTMQKYVSWISTFPDGVIPVVGALYPRAHTLYPISQDACSSYQYALGSFLAHMGLLPDT